MFDDPGLPGDPRIVQVFLTPFGSFNGSGNTTVPVTNFATFYVTGWTAQGGGFANPCQGNGDDPVPGNDAGYIVGHFIKYVFALNTGGGSGELCDFTSWKLRRGAHSREEVMQKLLATRGGTAAVAGAAALMAFLVFLLFMNQYRSSVDDSSEPVGVLIAKSLIPKGMSGDIVGTQELFQPTTAPKSQVKDGLSPIRPRSKVVSRSRTSIRASGSTSDFSTTTTDAIATKITADQRAVSIPLDEAHGLIGHVRAGDRVDILGGFNVVRVDRRGSPIQNAGSARPVMKLLMENIYVLEVPTDAGGGFGGVGNRRTSFCG